MFLISLTLGIVVVSLWLSWRRRKLSFFQDLDIPGPTPNVLFGNYLEILHEGQHICIERWLKQYGKVFGYYYGARPVLIVADLDILKQIQQKDFQKFSGRPPLFDVGESTRKFNRHAITTVNGKKWKVLRSTLTPTFTVSKLKKLSYIVDEAVDELVQAAENESANGRSFDIYRLYQNLTMDVIARTSLGVHSKAQINKTDPFVDLARLILTFSKDYLTMFTFSFTEFLPIFSFIRRIKSRWNNEGINPRKEMSRKVQAAIKVRRSDPNSRRPDVLQLMLDAQKSDENVSDKNLTAGENDEGPEVTKQATAKKGAGLTDDEVLQNATVFLIAGYETTSTALAFLTHCLIHNQDIQDRVREEINDNVPAGKNITYETVHSLQYLDSVLKEALRIYPPITYFVNRIATEDSIINGMKIPKDIAIQVPVYNLHHDPTIWEDPEEFKPERFSPEEKRNIHPMAFQTFGAGPRNCIGMRFAQMEAKIAIAKLVQKYRLVPKSDSTQEDFKVRYTLLTMRPEQGVEIQLEKI